MTKSLLRSGSLDDFQALGENGQPVYTSALQLRETLRLRQLQSVADCMAIPQSNEGGNRVDWYSPIDGDVVPWSAASETERTAALHHLEGCQAALRDTSQQMLNAERTEQQLFGALLAKVIQFPDNSHVYLVDGQPVLTFWGFVNANKSPRVNALDCLRPQVTAQATAPLPPPMVEKSVITPKVARPWWWRWLWLLLLLLLLLLGLFLLRSCMPIDPLAVSTTSTEEKRSDANQPKLDIVKPDRSLSAPLPNTGATATVGSLAQPAGNQPLVSQNVESQQPAVKETGVVMPANQPPEIPNINAPKPTAPLAGNQALPVDNMASNPPLPQITPPVQPNASDKEALTIPAEALKSGSTDFLNGDWRVISNVLDRDTGRPLNVSYHFKKGVGTVEVTRSNGTICRANTQAQMNTSGLTINKQQVDCGDKSGYDIPKVLCKPGAKNIADCHGQYDDKTTLSMMIKRKE